MKSNFSKPIMDSEWNSSTNLTWDHKRFSRDSFLFLITNWPIRSLIVLQFSQPSPEPIVPSTCALGFPFIVFGFIGNFTSLWCHRSIARYRSDDVVNFFYERLLNWEVHGHWSVPKSSSQYSDLQVRSMRLEINRSVMPRDPKTLPLFVVPLEKPEICN